MDRSLTAFAWMTTQKGQRRIVEVKLADESSTLMYRLWEPGTWRDRLPYGVEIGDEITRDD